MVLHGRTTQSRLRSARIYSNSVQGDEKLIDHSSDIAGFFEPVIRKIIDCIRTQTEDEPRAKVVSAMARKYLVLTLSRLFSFLEASGNQGTLYGFLSEHSQVSTS